MPPRHLAPHRPRRPASPVTVGLLVGLLLAPVAWVHAQTLTGSEATTKPSRPRAATPARQPATASPQQGWSAAAIADVPASYRTLYVRAATTCPRLTPQLLAGIGKIESNHGRLNLPGVRSGLNRYRDRAGRWRSCCAGPMQFNLTDGPPSTWQRWRRPGDNIYDPADAIPATARKLCHDGLGTGAFAARWKGRPSVDPCPDRAGPAHVDRALRRYNNLCRYAADVVAHARAYTGKGRS